MPKDFERGSAGDYDPPHNVAPRKSKSSTAGDYDSLYQSYLDLLDQVDHLSILREIGSAVNSTLELEEVLPTIATVVQSALDVSKITIYQIDKGGLTSRPIIAKYGSDLISKERLVEEQAQVRGAPMGNALDSRKPLIINTQYSSSAYVPLIARGNPLGILRLEDRRDGKAFDQDGSSLLQSVGTMVALALNNAQLYATAVMDRLTGLYVRRYFDIRIAEEVDQAQRYGKALSLLMLDLDHFKKLNDTYGRQTGDMVLQKCAQIVRDNTRKSDICCRFGGEEFAILLPENSIESAEILANKLCDHIATVPFIGSSDQVLKVTTSIGVAQFHEGMASAETFVQVTDEALYNAKAKGRNRVELADQP